MCVFFCEFMCTTGVQVLEKGLGSLGAGVTSNHELLCGFLKPNPSPLKASKALSHGAISPCILYCIFSSPEIQGPSPSASL